MWLHEIPVGGLLISPMVLYDQLGMVIGPVTFALLRKLGWHQQLWKSAWVYLSLFICFVALSLRVLSQG